MCCPGISGNATAESSQSQALAQGPASLPGHLPQCHPLTTPHSYKVTHSVLQVHMGETNLYHTLLDTPD